MSTAAIIIAVVIAIVLSLVSTNSIGTRGYTDPYGRMTFKEYAEGADFRTDEEKANDWGIGTHIMIDRTQVPLTYKEFARGAGTEDE